jgi:hypothetical protein
MMKQITTNDGSRIYVEDDVSDEIINILKQAPVLKFQEFHYTGNSSKGQNSGNYEELEEWIRSTGLDIWEVGENGFDRDIDWLMYNLDGTTGINKLSHRGKTVYYHAQGRKGEGHMQFGYTSRMEYRLISVKDA